MMHFDGLPQLVSARAHKSLLGILDYNHWTGLCINGLSSCAIWNAATASGVRSSNDH